MVDDMKIIGGNIRRIRTERKMTQVQLAKAIGVTVATISSYECGKTTPTRYLLEQIAWNLKTTPSEILSTTQAKDTFGYRD